MFDRGATGLGEGAVDVYASDWGGRTPEGMLRELLATLPESMGIEGAGLYLESSYGQLRCVASTADTPSRIPTPQEGGISHSFEGGHADVVLEVPVVDTRGALYLRRTGRAFTAAEVGEVACLERWVAPVLLRFELERTRRQRDAALQGCAERQQRTQILEDAMTRLGVGVLDLDDSGSVRASQTARDLFGAMGGVAEALPRVHEAIRGDSRGSMSMQGEDGALRRFDLEGLRENDHSLVLVRDVTELRRHEAEAAFLRERLHVLIQSMHSAVLVETAHREIAVTNHAFCELFGILAPPEAMVGADCAGAAEQTKVLFKDPEGWLSRVDEILAARKAVIGETVRMWDDRVLERDYVPVMVEGEYSGHLWQYRDVTEHEKRAATLSDARREADRANEAKSRFLAMMSHDMRTPLGSLLGNAELLRDELAGTKRDQAEGIMRSAQTLLGLIEDLLDVMVSEAGELSLDPRPVDLAALVRHVVRINGPRARETGTQIAIDVPSTVAMVSADPRRVEQVVGNLVGNAVKFAAGGRVDVALEATADGDDVEVRLEVRDDGIGMDEEALAQVFEPFRQADASIRGNFGGTGLGLSITRSIVDRMGGAIEVESEPGRGTTFRVTFRAPRVAEKSKSGKMEIPLAMGAEVLVVEDDPENREYVTRALRRAGVTVRAVEDGAAVIGAVAQHPPDLVIMDLDMRYVGGLEATRLLRAWEQDAKRDPVTVVALTANADPTVAEQCREMGMQAVATKPITPTELVALVRAQAAPPVCIVDDDPDFRALVAFTLRAAGVRVQEVGSGEELQRHPLSKRAMVLLDRHLGTVSGLDLAKDLRARGHLGPVVLMTGDGSPSLREESRDHGVDDVWLKPLPRDVLAERVKAMLWT